MREIDVFKDNKYNNRLMTFDFFSLILALVRKDFDQTLQKFVDLTVVWTISAL